MIKAFVLAAGLGTRLRPLTEHLPKPLIPVGLKPLITFAFDHLMADAGVAEFVINTHHCSEAYRAAFPDGFYRSHPLRFRHEPVLLDTGGGIRNVADLLGGGTFIVYNGDILTDLPIGPAIAEHRVAGNLVTLILRSRGEAPLHIAWDAGRIRDIHNQLGTGLPSAYSFTGIYLVEPGFIERIPPSRVISVIPIFLEMIRRGEPLGGIVIDEGEWHDLGTRAEYLRVHRGLRLGGFPRYGAPDAGWRRWIDPSAIVAADARIVGASTLGAGAVVGDGVVIEDTIVWPGAKIASQSRLKGCIVRASQAAAGQWVDKDF